MEEDVCICDNGEISFIFTFKDQFWGSNQKLQIFQTQLSKTLEFCLRQICKKE